MKSAFYFTPFVVVALITGCDGDTYGPTNEDAPPASERTVDQSTDPTTSPAPSTTPGSTTGTPPVTDESVNDETEATETVVAPDVTEEPAENLPDES